MWERVEAAQTLAFLTEVSTELQKTAAMTDHLIQTMTDYLKYQPPSSPSPPSVSPTYIISPIVSLFYVI